MKVAVAHGPGNNVQELRKLLHGVGAQCASEDCVLWNDLAVRLGQSDVDLIVVQAAEAADWASIMEAKSFSSAPMIAIGPNGAVEAAAREAGVAEYVANDRLRGGLDEVLSRMVGGGAIRCARGSIFSVIAPTAGNGGTFVSTNLAGQLHSVAGGESVLVDICCGFSKVGLMLDAHPEHSLEDVCGRIHRTDRFSLLSYFHKDPTGAKLLYGDPERSNDSFLNSDVVRKLTVLTRMAASATIFQIGAAIRQPQVDAMRTSDRVVVVVRPDVPSLNRAAMTMDQLGRYGVSPERLLVVINFWGEAGLASKQHIEETLNWKDPFYLSYDPGRVNRCTNEGRLLQTRYPRCRVAKQLGKLAQMLMTPKK
jgi:Flp pilus assembly CpaE family ATPase